MKTPIAAISFMVTAAVAWPVYAFIDPCRECTFMLTVCCTKPCPTIDKARRGAERAKTTALASRTYLEDNQNQRRDETNDIIGRRGPRPSTQQDICFVPDNIITEDIHAIQRAQIPPDDPGQSSENIYEGLRQRILAESARIHSAAAAALAKSEDDAQKISSSVQQTQDLRDLFRAAASVRASSVPLRALSLELNAARLRLASVHAAGNPQTWKDAPQ